MQLAALQVWGCWHWGRAPLTPVIANIPLSQVRTPKGHGQHGERGRVSCPGSATFTAQGTSAPDGGTRRAVKPRDTRGCEVSHFIIYRSSSANSGL